MPEQPICPGSPIIPGPILPPPIIIPDPPICAKAAPPTARVAATASAAVRNLFMSLTSSLFKFTRPRRGARPVPHPSSTPQPSSRGLTNGVSGTEACLRRNRRSLSTGMSSAPAPRPDAFLKDGLAGVDHQSGAGDVGRLIAGKEEDRVGDLPRLRPAPEEVVLPALRPQLGLRHALGRGPSDVRKA